MQNEWWRGGVIYQIYPRSFMDSNGDGIGDISGIINKLDYIADLNVDAIWLSPFFKSPMKDFGYDVSDYIDVDPMFGNIDDFKLLVDEAHKRDLKVIIDQVYSHTSDQHDWFTQSRANRTNDKADWYVWADAKPDGTPPNNWLSLFGGPAWQWDSRRAQYYMHNFLTSQPDLNFHCPAVQDAILEAAKFWLDLGVDGFRLDVVNMYFHNKDLPDNEIADSPEKIFVGIDPINPFSRQFHTNQMCRSDNLEFLKRLRSLLDQYSERTTVGEIGAPNSVDYMAQYTSGGDKLHMAYTFELLGDNCSPSYLKSTLERINNKLSDGWPCFSLSNHDVIRSATRWTRNCSDPAKKIATMLALLLTQRGSPCLYQGEELGLPEADVPFEALQDPYGIEFWPEFKGRDGCRTPMPWDNSGSMGFGQNDNYWLPIDPTHRTLNAQAQQVDEHSTLHFLKDFLLWRKRQPALIDGTQNWLESDQNLLLFERKQQNQTLAIAINLTEHILSAPAMNNMYLVQGALNADGDIPAYGFVIWQQSEV